MHILGLDVGTSSVKAAVLDVETARAVGPIARASYPLDQPTPDTATIDPERLWSAVIQAGRQAAESRRVDGIGFSCLSPALVLLDAKDRPLTPIITHLDRRSRPEAQRAWAEVGQEFLATVGNKPLPGGLTALSFQSLVHTEPRLAQKVRRYLHINGWLGLRLTGDTAFDWGNACFSGLFEAMTAKSWSPRWCDYFGVDRIWLPPVRSGDETLGTLREDVAKDLGVESGIPVKLGAADTSCAMLAARMGRDDLLHVVGTTQVLAVFTDRPEPATNRLTRMLGVGDAFIRVAHNPVGGVALDWMHQLCFRDQSAEEYYQRSILAAIGRSTSVIFDPPFLGGDRLEIEPRRAAFRELALATDRLDLLAALLQAMRQHHYEALKALGDPVVNRRVFLSGGGAEVLRQLLPEYAENEPTILEEASLCGVARLFGER